MQKLGIQNLIILLFYLNIIHKNSIKLKKLLSKNVNNLSARQK